MPVEHQVWIKFHDHVDAARREHHLAGLRSLTAKVPGILELKVGQNFTDRAKGFTHGLSVTLEDKAALEVYGPHPEHQKVAGALKEDAELMALDFTF